MKNSLKYFLLVALSTSVAMPVYADWRSPLASATAWISQKSASAVTHVGNWFTQYGTYVPNTSAVITDISEPIPMNSVPMPISIISDVPSIPVIVQEALQQDMPATPQLPLENKWYELIINKFAHMPRVMHTVWNALYEYKKPLLWAVGIGTVSACAWKVYKKLNAIDSQLNDNRLIDFRSNAWQRESESQKKLAENRLTVGFKLIQDKVKLQTNVNTLKEKNKNLKKERDNIQEQLEQSKMTRLRLQEQLEKAEKCLIVELQLLQDKIGLQDDVDTLKEKNKNLKKKRSNIQEQLEQSKVTRLRLQEQLEEAERANLILKEQLKQSEMANSNDIDDVLKMLNSIEE